MRNTPIRARISNILFSKTFIRENETFKNFFKTKTVYFV